uniref:Uncharacterized protein n=1 Tax=Oryza barthii TaxID=65489 RepID=A0A0D3HBH2_9ORYZ
MATSPLPRWAPTPSPSLPLWRTSPGGGDGATVRGFLRSTFRTVLAALRGRRAAPRGDTAPPRPLHPAAAAATTEHAAASGFDSIEQKMFQSQHASPIASPREEQQRLLNPRAPGSGSMRRKELHGGSSSWRKELHAVVDPRTWGCRIA